jgi:hypothetical protein
VVRAGPGGYLHLGAVNWQVDPFSLLMLAPRVKLTSRWGSQSLATTVVLRGGQDIDLYELSASLPADLLRQFVPVSLAGVLNAQVEHLQLREGLPVEGAGRLVWQNGGWQAPTGPVPLGTYALDFRQAPGEELAGDVLTLTGPVSAEGGVYLAGRSYGVDITVGGEPLDERLKQALSLMARPLGQGYRIKLEGEF